MAETRTLSGGEKLIAALENISRSVKRGASLKVGFLSGATYPDGKSVAMIAAIQNFGAPSRNIPPRPFFTNMIRRESSGWPDLMQAQLKATGYDAKTTMERMGAVLKGQLQLSIRTGPFAPLKPATVARKGFATPLIDTGHMINSVDWQVDEL